jgi:hypothetical protein
MVCELLALGAKGGLLYDRNTPGFFSIELESEDLARYQAIHAARMRMSERECAALDYIAQCEAAAIVSGQQDAETRGEEDAESGPAEGKFP